MTTERLYYGDPHLTAFSARVLSCERGKRGWETVLDRTAFYPEGGGQPCDLGTLGGAAVTDVRERDGVIVHTCAAPLEPGSEAAGEIDRARRDDLTEQHSGEHIVSGIIHRKYGYENVGFHMGADFVTIDLSGELTEAQLRGVEDEANRAVRADLPIRAFFADEAQLASLPYRSKKALTGPVRLVEIPGIDRCACCGTHAERTGEIGLIRLFSAVRFRGGVRVELLCGRRCLAYLNGIYEQNRAVSNLLSAKPLETAAAAERTARELADAKYRLTRLEDSVFAQKAEALRGAGDVLLFEEGLSPDGVRRLAAAVVETCGGRAAVFSPDGHGCRYAVGRRGGDLRAFAAAMNAALRGRGGGKPDFVQGSAEATADEVRAFFGANGG